MQLSRRKVSTIFDNLVVVYRSVVVWARKPIRDHTTALLFYWLTIENQTHKSRQEGANGLGRRRPLLSRVAL